MFEYILGKIGAFRFKIYLKVDTFALYVGSRNLIIPMLRPKKPLFGLFESWFGAVMKFVGHCSGLKRHLFDLFEGIKFDILPPESKLWFKFWHSKMVIFSICKLKNLVFWTF